MRFIKFITVSAFALLIAACATEEKGIDAYKGKTAKQIYDGGKQAVSKKQYDVAIQNFEALEALYPFGEYAEPGELNLIYAYYANNDLDATAAVAGSYIHLYPRGSHVDYAYYMRGLANFDKSKSWFNVVYVKDPSQRDLSSMRQAFVDFSELVEQFPKSKYTPDAHQRMVYIRNLIANYELQTAQFYFDRKAYVAAANRASYIVVHFEGAPAIPNALKIMINSYNELGATKQANDALQVLKTNYPNEKL
jgi:outer membrane protein assembly factor BamD